MSRATLSRRTMLQGTGVAVATAFVPGCRRWSSEQGPGTEPLPALDGRLLMDAASRTKAAEDYGHMVHRQPWAVLVPGSGEDIAKMVRFARARGLQVAASRGLGESHNTVGRAQAEAGLVIDMSALAALHELNETSAWVDAGMRWSKLLEATLPLGRGPPTMTDYIELSIGGCLSVGGIGGQTYRHGLQVDNVLELEVVTGRGELVRCSPSENAELFHAVRGGLGQFGIIVRARIKLVPVPPKARVYTASYTDLATFLADQQRLLARGQFDYVEGQVVPVGKGRAFQLEVAKYFTPGAEPVDAELLAGLSFTPDSLKTHDSGYPEFVNRLAPTVAFLERMGVWGHPHPWLNMFVPAEATAAFVQWVLEQTPVEEMGQDPVLLYPFVPGKLTAPFVRVPSGDTAFLFALLRTANPPTPENVQALREKNQTLLTRLAAVGGRAYLVSQGPRNPAEWREHFHPVWEAFQAAKTAFDPDHVLTPGQGIF